jgi:hypothetical protein
MSHLKPNKKGKSQADQKRSPWWLLPEDDWRAVKDIAAQLGETEPAPLYQIGHIVRCCGAEFAEQIAQKALEVEANGGMLADLFTIQVAVLAIAVLTAASGMVTAVLLPETALLNTKTNIEKRYPLRSETPKTKL